MMATSTANAPTASANGSGLKAGGSTQQQNKSFAAKMAEGARQSDEDGSAKRAGQPKAWTSGVNPITQRSNSSNMVNGGAVNKIANSREKSPDRQAWVFNHAVGLECSLTTKTPQTFTGVFAGMVKANNDQKLVFRMVRDVTLKATDETNGGYVGHGPDHTMVFFWSSLLSVDIPEAVVTTKAASANGATGFRTDTDISGNRNIRERNLQRWEAGPTDKSLDLSLDSHTGEWDQFKTNEQQFGVRSDYDETMYTTAIDRSNPLYSMREKEAERIAREIEGSTTLNAHVREERGLADDGEDEEEKYSGVRREFSSLQTNQPGKYVPPSRRNQVATTTPQFSQTTHNDPTLDPAIISSQIARPDSSEPKTASQKASAPAVSTSATVATAPAPVATGPSNSVAGAKDVKTTREVPQSSALSSKNIEHKVLDSFHQFAANEKIKIQDQKRTRASADKAVKLNDLMKFSKNFKLLTPVPKDLVPILAKDEIKQKEIVDKAQQNAETAVKSPKSASMLADAKRGNFLAAARWEGEAPGPSADRARLASATQQQKGHVGQPRMNPTSLSAKLSDHHRAHKAGLQAQIPTTGPIQETRRESRGSAHTSTVTSPQKPAAGRGPSASTLKFNAKALEFRPTASSFKPSNSSASTAVASSPRSGPTTRTISPNGPNMSKFWAEKKTFAKRDTRPTPADVVKQKKADNTASSSDVASKPAVPVPAATQGGFQHPYRTPPTWTVGDDLDKGPDYKEVFDERHPKRFQTPQPHISAGGAIPHAYQMPGHMATPGPHGMNMQHPHAGHPVSHQPSPYGHHAQFDDHQMRSSASQSSHFASHSPRMQQQNVPYQSPMPAQAQMAYAHPGQFPVQTPPMGGRQFSNPQMVPMQGGHLAPMMMPQHSAGGFMPQHVAMPYNPQMAMYQGPGPNPPVFGSPGQHANGFPSPGRGAPMMMHQGSQQGQQPVYMSTAPYGQPIYTQQPPAHMAMRPNFGSPQPGFAQHSYPQHHYPQQIHRTPSQGYAQPHHVPPQQHLPTPQVAPQQPVGNGDHAEEGKS